MRKIAPSEKKKQELEGLLRGESSELSGGGILSRFIKLSVEKTLQELLELEQAEFLGRERYRRREQAEPGEGVYRNGYEAGRVKTAEGVLEVSKPQVRGLEEPYRSSLWEKLRGASEQLKDLVIEMYTLGMSTRDVEIPLRPSHFRLSPSQAQNGEVGSRTWKRELGSLRGGLDPNFETSLAICSQGPHTAEEKS